MNKNVYNIKKIKSKGNLDFYSYFHFYNIFHHNDDDDDDDDSLSYINIVRQIVKKKTVHLFGFVRIVLDLTINKVPSRYYYYYFDV